MRDYKMKWLRIDEKVPTDKQKVFYYFALFDDVCEGKYVKPDEFEVDGQKYRVVNHIFVGPMGFLGDDVTYWMPRKEGDPFPEPPTDEQKKTDLYYPAKICRICEELVINGNMRAHAEAHNPNAKGLDFEELPYK